MKICSPILLGQLKKIQHPDKYFTIVKLLTQHGGKNVQSLRKLLKTSKETIIVPNTTFLKMSTQKGQ